MDAFSGDPRANRKHGCASISEMGERVDSTENEQMDEIHSIATTYTSVFQASVDRVLTGFQPICGGQ